MITQHESTEATVKYARPSRIRAAGHPRGVSIKTCLDHNFVALVCFGSTLIARTRQRGMAVAHLAARLGLPAAVCVRHAYVRKHSRS